MVHTFAGNLLLWWLRRVDMTSIREIRQPAAPSEMEGET
jgi:hypothetical protein